MLKAAVMLPGEPQRRFAGRATGDAGAAASSRSDRYVQTCTPLQRTRIPRGFSHSVHAATDIHNTGRRPAKAQGFALKEFLQGVGASLRAQRSCVRVLTGDGAPVRAHLL